MNTEIKHLDKSKVEISFVLDEQEFAGYFEKALEHVKSHMKMDGFRAGKVPKDVVEKRVGQESVLMEAGDLAVNASYRKAIAEHGLEPVANPEVQMKKIAKGSPCEFVVTVEVLPKADLPDYRGIAREAKLQEVAVSEEELQDAINYLQRSRAKMSPKEAAEAKDFVEIEYQNEHINSGNPVRDRFVLGEGGFLKDFEENLKGMKAGEEREFKAQFPENTPDKKLAGKEGSFAVKMLAVQRMELPPLNDEFARQLGMFDTLVKLKENVREGMLQEKQEAARQERRGRLLESIAAQMKLELPRGMVEAEQERLFDEFKDQVASQTKVAFDDYLSSIKKKEDEVKETFKAQAEKRIKDFLVLREIAKQERIEVSADELQEEMNLALRRYTKEQAEKIDIVRLREYTKEGLVNEKVFQLLESLSDKGEKSKSKINN